MNLGDKIFKLRNESGMSQEKFAEMMQVSRQAVQKWESGATLPDMDKIVKIAKYFNISLDSFICGRTLRVAEESHKTINPEYSALHIWEKYSFDMEVEYSQSIDEGLDISAYKPLFNAINKLPDNEYRSELADIIFKITQNAPQVKNYKYFEPSDYEEIEKCLKEYPSKLSCPDKDVLKSKLLGAWYGRIAGCLLGKPIEGIQRDELHRLLRETENYPMHRYILNSDIEKIDYNSYEFSLHGKCYADTINTAPADDDTNYTVLYSNVVEKYGRDFSSEDVAEAWLALQPKYAYCTAERVAFCNFVNGYMPPNSAIYKNHYREYIGAQIRADYFGYINPANPKAAAKMAFRDASISHIKNGIYGEMFVAAMLSAAAATKNMVDIIYIGLAEIPENSRLYTRINSIITDYKSGISQEDAFTKITKQYDDKNGYHWCHTISNAEIVVASLLYGNGDFGKSICMAVQTGFDTDCNGATVGSIVGMINGMDGIDKKWIAPLNGKLKTEIFGVGTVEISQMAETALTHIAK